MKPRFWTFFLALAVSAAAPTVGLAQLVWDTSTTAGFQNGNGTWGTDNFWTTTTGGGTTLTAWTSGTEAWFGGNATVAATPAGDFTITVSGSQRVSIARQIQFGAGNFTLQSGTLHANGFRADQGTMTVNSTIVTGTGANNWMAFTAITGTSTIILGGDNTFTNIARIGGSGSGGGKILLNHQNALGLGTEVLFGNGASLDLNGYSISGKSISVTDTRTGFLVNTGTAAAEWSGNVLMPNASAVGFRAGGTGGEVNISGVISGSIGNQVQSLDNGTLRLSGVNTYSGTTVVRDGSTLIVGNASALGSTAAGTFINAGTLDLNGFNVGNEAFTLQQTTSRLVNNSTSSAATVGGNVSISLATGTIGGAGNLTLGGVISSAVTGGFSKIGSGTLTLTGINTYSGSTTIAAGILDITSGNAIQSTSGVFIADAARLRYSGGTGSVDRAISVTSGTGTVENTGGGTLTLSGSLAKNGTVLRLTGGSFNVTGLITGTNANSDLVVAGTSTVTLSNTNTYNGPTFVNQSSTLVLGTNNAIPGNSVVTLGDATTTGTLNANGFTNAIGGLAFGSGGGTLRLAATSTSAAPLTAATGTMTLTNGTLDLAGSGSTAGLYRVLSAQSVSGSFTSVTGASAAYQVITSATSVDYQQRAVLGAVAVTNPASTIITGGSAAFTYTVANAALAGGASLSFTGTGLSNVAGPSSGSAAASGTSSSVSGLIFTGTSVGTLQQGTFTVSAPSAFGTTTSTGTVAVTVLDHATSSLGSGPSAVLSTVLNLGTWDYGSSTWTSGTSSGQFSIFNLASSFGSSLTADLSLVSVSGTGNGFTTNLGTYTDIAGGSSQQYSVFVNPASFLTSGTQSVTFTIAMSDKTGMAGATPSNTLSVTANVVVVPEPGALALAGLGIAAAWALRRRS